MWLAEGSNPVTNQLFALCVQELEQNTVEHISASVKAGQLLAVIGPVGAGKVSHWIASTQSAMAVLSGHKMEGSVTGQPVPSQPWWFCHGTRWQSVIG